MTVAIVGAGMAGLSAARALKAAGHEVELFDKGRGPGGRMSTRRSTTPLGEVRFDHGAQYFTARDPEFLAMISGFEQDGAVAVWAGRFVDIDTRGQATPMRDEQRFVGAPGMNGIIRAMAAPFGASWGKRLVSAARTGASWQLDFEDGDSRGGFGQLIIAVPAEQAAELLRPVHPGFADEAASAVSAPCWAVMLAFEAPVQTPWDAARLKQGPISWMARNSSKPGRAETETWTLHASPEWSKANLEKRPEEVAPLLIEAFAEHASFSAPVHAAAHRWRYSQIMTAAETGCAWDADRHLGVCGDWRVSARVESAWLSGRALAHRILQG